MRTFLIINGNRSYLQNYFRGPGSVEELLKLAPDMYDITVFGAEQHPNYNRILLSPVHSPTRCSLLRFAKRRFSGSTPEPHSDSVSDRMTIG